MGVFNQEEPISKEYLKSMGFQPHIDEKYWDIYFTLPLKTKMKYMSFRHRLYYIPSIGKCELDYVYFDNKIIKRVKYYTKPITQFDMNALIEECRIFISKINKVSLDHIIIEP